MEIQQALQQKILVKLMHHPGLGFNELWSKDGESNTFAYHVKSLVESGLIEKKDEQYFLSVEGKTYVTHLDGATGKTRNKPVVCSFILATIPNEKKVLVNIRKKEPFYNHLGIPGGKIDFGSSPMKTAEEEFLEETGLHGDLRLLSISNYTTEENGTMMHHVIAYTYLCEYPKGMLLENTREGINKWIYLDELDKYTCYPEIPHFIKTSLMNKHKVNFFNIKRWMKDGEFLRQFEIQDSF
jgi:ADP-ribose pyrophosphatase YjhB (NUDIX family)